MRNGAATTIKMKKKTHRLMLKDLRGGLHRGQLKGKRTLVKSTTTLVAAKTICDIEPKRPG